jgi:hypothetical protein
VSAAVDASGLSELSCDRRVARLMPTRRTHLLHGRAISDLIRPRLVQHRTRLSSGADAQYRFSDRWRSTILVQSRTHGVDPLRAAEGYWTLAASVDWATDASGDPVFSSVRRQWLYFVEGLRNSPLAGHGW